MAQAINLQITPSNVMPKIYASQFDIGREIEINLYDGASAYTPPVGTDIRFEGKKPDGNGFSYACTYTGNVVTVVTTDQMTVLAGEIPCELRMSLNGDDIGTLNIIFVIEKSPIDENVPISDTEIPAIIELARDEQYAAEAWATGERNGVPVGPTDPQYHNNAKYWAEHAEYGALDDLTDVEITTPSDGDFLQFTGADSEWKNTHDEISAIENVYGSKNLLHPTNSSTTPNGATITYNADGTITKSGTVSGGDAQIAFAVPTNADYVFPARLEVGRKYRLSGCPSGGSNSTYEIYIQFRNADNTAWVNAYHDYGDGVEFTAENARFGVYVRAFNGNTSTVTFSPMICDARIKDLTFASPAPTNRDLAYVRDGWQKNGAYNIAPNDITSQVLNGVTVVKNADNTVTLNNTAVSPGFTLYAFNKIQIPDGTYKLVGCPSGASDNFRMTLLCNNNNTSKGNDTGSGLIFTYNASTDINLSLYLWVKTGYTCDNVVFKPMITTDLNATYNDYVPYAMTNRELTEKVDELYGKEAVYAGGQYTYSSSITSIATICQTLLNDIPVTTGLYTNINVLAKTNAVWKITGYVNDSKTVASLLCMRYDGTLNYFYRSGGTDTVKTVTLS